MTEPAWEKAHREAMAAGASHYRDPATGYRELAPAELDAINEWITLGALND